MSAQPIPGPPGQGLNLDSVPITSAAGNSSLWDRVTTWASENKAVIYTVAGVAVVVSGAGVVYYLRDTQKNQTTSPRKISKKEKRKAKKDKEAAEATIASSSPKQAEQPGNTMITLLHEMSLLRISW